MLQGCNLTGNLPISWASNMPLLSVLDLNYNSLSGERNYCNCPHPLTSQALQQCDEFVTAVVARMSATLRHAHLHQGNGKSRTIIGRRLRCCRDAAAGVAEHGGHGIPQHCRQQPARHPPIRVSPSCPLSFLRPATQAEFAACMAFKAAMPSQIQRPNRLFRKIKYKHHLPGAERNRPCAGGPPMARSRGRTCRSSTWTPTCSTAAFRPPGARAAPCPAFATSRSSATTSVALCLPPGRSTLPAEHTSQTSKHSTSSLVRQSLRPSHRFCKPHASLATSCGTALVPPCLTSQMSTFRQSELV